MRKKQYAVRLDEATIARVQAIADGIARQPFVALATSGESSIAAALRLCIALGLPSAELQLEMTENAQRQLNELLKIDLNALKEGADDANDDSDLPEVNELE